MLIIVIGNIIGLIGLSVAGWFLADLLLALSQKAHGGKSESRQSIIHSFPLHNLLATVTGPFMVRSPFFSIFFNSFKLILLNSLMKAVSRVTWSIVKAVDNTWLVVLVNKSLWKFSPFKLLVSKLPFTVNPFKKSLLITGQNSDQKHSKNSVDDTASNIGERHLGSRRVPEL